MRISDTPPDLPRPPKGGSGVSRPGMDLQPLGMSPITWVVLDRARSDVIRAALNYVQTQLYMEAYPEDPHGGDSVDLASDHLDEMLTEWASLQQKYNPQPEGEQNE